MPHELPVALKGGQPARLFPDFAMTSREKRITSILLALLPQIPELAKTVFASIGVRIGVRSRIETWTEVVFKSDADSACRPDGFVCVTNGSTIWTALIEAKIGRASLEADQVQRYIDLAKSNKIDAVITISNEFVTRANHSPVDIPKGKRRNIELFHWSWTWIATECEILQSQTAVTDREQVFLLREFHHFLNSEGTGVERFNQMGPLWKDLVTACVQQHSLKWNAPEVEDGVSAWLMEERDLQLQLSRLVGEPVQTVVERRFRDDAAGRLRLTSDRLVSEKCLATSYRVPNAAGDLEIVANLAHRTLCASVKIRAPQDKVKTGSRLKWLLRMLKDDDDRLHVRAHWPGKAAPTVKPLKELRDAPELTQADNPALAPHTFEVLMIGADSKRFQGRKTFVEELETLVPTFYSIVVQHLREWTPPPPKPRLHEAHDEPEAEGQGIESWDTSFDPELQ
jgi:hypothetical protein